MKRMLGVPIKEVFTSFHKNNVIFYGWRPPNFYAILIRAVLNKINRAVYF